MSGFVDATSTTAVEAVLDRGLRVLGLDGVIGQLGTLPGLEVIPARPGGLLRRATPAAVGYGDQQLLAIPGRATLHHVVGGVRLSSEPVPPTRLPGVLAALVVRSVTDLGTADDVAVALTALRDALDAAG